MNKSIVLKDLISRIPLNKNINELQVPAELSKSNYLKDIFLLIKRNKAVKKISICDDYLDPLDRDTQYFCTRVMEERPDIVLDWISEFKIDGRYGR